MRRRGCGLCCKPTRDASERRAFDQRNESAAHDPYMPRTVDTYATADGQIDQFKFWCALTDVRERSLRGVCHLEDWHKQAILHRGLSRDCDPRGAKRSVNRHLLREVVPDRP